jgi:hypothetical protein
VASIPKLQRKLHKRKRARDKQVRLFKKTKKNGHARAAQRHAAAVRYLRQRIQHKRETQTLGERAHEVAVGLIGVMEEGGNNVGKTVEKIIRANGGVPGEPWCGDFQAYCYSLAGSRLVQRGWASVSMLGGLAGITRTTNPKVGDLVRYTFDHVGMFEKDNGDGTITTIEGNTGASGAVSDSTTGGDGVYRKVRDKSLVADYLHVTR